MFRNLVLLTALGCVFAQDVNRCAWGESYWCSNLKVAKMCGAVDHCISTLWARTTLPKDSNTTCQFCENIIADVRNYLTNKQTEDQIQQFLDTACSIIPEPELATQCKQTVDQDLPELFDMIKAELDPQVICAAIGLCSGLQDLVSHREPSKPKDPIEQMQKAVMTDICADCKVAMTELKQIISETTTEQEIEAFISTELCANLGSLEDTCKELVAAYVPELLQMLASDIDAATICGELGFCNRTADMVKEFQRMHLKTQAKALRKSGPKAKVSASTECIACEFVMKELDGLLDENSTQQEIMAALDKVCSLLPSTVSTECDNFVNTYGPAVLALLEQELQPSQICSVLGLCSTKYVDRVQADDCPECMAVVNYVESLLKENATEGDIEKVLDKVCNFLPDTMKTECDDLVKQYSPIIIQLILSETTPKEICEFIKMCTSTKAEEIIVPKKAQLVGENECTWGPSYWCASRKNAKMCKQEIMAALDKVCSLLPSTVSTECDNFVNTYGPAVLALLEQELQPSQICSILGLCSTKYVDRVTGDEECTICITVVNYVESLLEENSTEADIEKALEKVCNFLPEAIKRECNDIVDQFLQVLVKLLLQALTPKEICEDIRLCPSTQAEEIIVPKKVQLVGENECTWGPSYWCASRKNAKMCKCCSSTF